MSHRESEQPQQLELPLQVSASPSFQVTRLESGHVVLSPAKVDLWISVADAAEMLNRSERWVREMIHAKTLRARRFPGARKWDVDGLHVQELLETAKDWS